MTLADRLRRDTDNQHRADYFASGPKRRTRRPDSSEREAAQEAERERRSNAQQERDRAEQDARAAGREFQQLRAAAIGRLKAFQRSVPYAVGAAERARDEAVRRCDLEGAVAAQLRVAALHKLEPTILHQLHYVSSTVVKAEELAAIGEVPS